MRIDDYLRQPGNVEDCDLDFEKLIDDERVTGKLDAAERTMLAAEMWAAIASGEADVEQTLRWAQYVAGKVTANVVNGAERDAAPAALKAIGFFGRGDPYRGAREFMATLGAFPVIDEHGQAVRAPRLAASAWLKLLRGAGHMLDVDDKTAINRINEIRNDLGIG